ncbi:MAG: type II toxin-antitoxin system VapC family toxin [Chloroflexota bacterium]|nr:type II toxin-antitoxin system VapC family toxin [Chloroflexota bacterium]MDE2891522.1 type II toxin-antitoxin system VapC family toxin [Chloroflexota bacterium]
MYLLDTNVVSELRRARPDRSVLAWLDGVPSEDLFFSAMTIAEIQRGIEKCRIDEPDHARELTDWLERRLLVGFEILPFDSRAAREWGRMMHNQPDRLAQDAVIAATASSHSLTVATRNVKDFRRLGAAYLNPFAFGR